MGRSVWDSLENTKINAAHFAYRKNEAMVYTPIPPPPSANPEARWQG